MAGFNCVMKNTYTYFFGKRVTTGKEFDLTDSTSTSTTQCRKN